MILLPYLKFDSLNAGNDNVIINFKPLYWLFILDCTSLNLPSAYRVPTHNPEVSQVFKISRDWCYAVAKERARLLKAKKTVQ